MNFALKRINRAGVDIIGRQYHQPMGASFPPFIFRSRYRDGGTRRRTDATQCWELNAIEFSLL